MLTFEMVEGNGFRVRCRAKLEGENQPYGQIPFNSQVIWTTSTNKVKLAKFLTQNQIDQNFAQAAMVGVDQNKPWTHYGDVLLLAGGLADGEEVTLTLHCEVHRTLPGGEKETKMVDANLHVVSDKPDGGEPVVRIADIQIVKE